MLDDFEQVLDAAVFRCNVGKVSFHAAVNLNNGPGKFLQRLGLKGEVSLAQVSFAKPGTQHDMDAFAARVQKDPSRRFQERSTPGDGDRLIANHLQ